MPYFSRQIGTVNSLITVFLPDRTVSTGAGLANIVASTVRLTWLRSDQAAVSSWTLTTGTLGTWAASTMTQVGSTSTLGAYQFSLPNGLFISGDTAYAQIMSSTATFAEVPLVFELTKTDNQSYLSSQTIGFVRNNVSVSAATIPFGISTGVVSVSAATIPFGVSSISTPVTASSVTAAVNVSSIYGSAAVTSAAGVWGPLSVSSITTPVTASTAGVTSISIPVGVSTGTVRVSAATIPFGVSSITGPVSVSSLTANAMGNFFDTAAFLFSTAVVSSVVFEIATNATVGGNVGVSAVTIPIGVSSISTPVSASSVTAPVGVSTVTIPVGVSTGTVAVSSATAGVNEGIADAFLLRNVSSGANTGRTVREALYVLRNKVDVNLGLVYATDDTTSSWAFTVSTVAGDPIQVIDPS